jgi:lipid II:glycine glycyltransferase (peptidoglycan interpeptide bridge formation enzyme)
LVVRDGLSARYIIGALDVEGLGERESPSVLLHWHAMRDFQARGARVYDLGTSSGPVHRFKQKFRPTERHLALPVTIVLHPWAYRAWMGMALTPMRSVWPRLKRLLTR